MNITEAELKTLRDSTNEQQWNDACDAIKRVRNNKYPPDWFQKVMMSGLATTIQTSW